MDPLYRFPASPGTPLFQVSPERVNQQRYEPTASPSTTSGAHSRDSSVHEKVAKFDSLTFQGKALERKTNDAALKRAMLGREEAESEMRRYREEARTLRKQVEDGRDRERKVGERLETVMENYGRAKETHAHTQALWEKEIRRARKESFRSQSVVVKLQEELKAARLSLRTSEIGFEQEKGRSMKREQEAFAARYQLVGVQEELANVMEKIKLVEQERDALKTIAKNEEIARIAAEGRIPLPPSRQDDDEFASPKKASRTLPQVTVVSSAASEEELEQLRTELAWERRRANRAYEHAQYMQVECQFKCCSCKLAESKGESFQFVPESTTIRPAAQGTSKASDETSHDSSQSHEHSRTTSLDESVTHQNTIFIPSEGVFRTITPALEESPWISPAKPITARQASSRASRPNEAPAVAQQPLHCRTPSCEPPSTAMVPEVSTSLLSLLDNNGGGSSDGDDTTTIITRPQSQPTEKADSPISTASPSASPRHSESEAEEQPEPIFHTISTTTTIPLARTPSPSCSPSPSNPTSPPSPTQQNTSHGSSSSSFSSAQESLSRSQSRDHDTAPQSTHATAQAEGRASAQPHLRTPSTVSREAALAQIRERRGRARSLAQGGAVTPRRPLGGIGAGMAMTERRDYSEPIAGAAAAGSRSVSRGAGLVRGRSGGRG